MLAFEVEYLLRRSFSGSYKDRSEEEWPPHPSRFFSALVSASFGHNAPPDARKALEWLEQQSPPSIYAPMGDPGNPVTAFVPPNYWFGKQPRVFPSVILREPSVYFVWNHASPDEETKGQLGQLAERVGYLGRSPSLVRVALCDNPPQPNYLPDAEGEESLRVPNGGRLAELRESFDNSLRSTSGARNLYRHIGNQASLPQANFGDMIILRKAAGFPVPVTGALVVTEQARKALISVADSRGLNCTAIHGHEPDTPHVAYAALPFAGSKHADGRLMGLALLLPRQLEADQKKRVRAAAMFLDKLYLGPTLGSWSLSVDGDEWPVALRPRTWTGPARTWATVTPVLLDRFPKKNLPADSIILESCRRSGLPEPIGVKHDLYPMLGGIAPVPEFKLQRNEKPRPEWGVHVKLTFGEKVRGPILLGRGRFFGMGLFRPLSEVEDHDS